MEEEIDLLVTITVDFQTDEYPGIPQCSVFRFVDVAPEFEISDGIIDAYAGFPGAKFRIEHHELPEVSAPTNHYGSVRIH
jgi:hypothetical protein